MEITQEQFEAYLKVQFSGDYNMITQSIDARHEAGLSESEYYYIQSHYGYLRDKYSNSYLKIRSEVK